MEQLAWTAVAMALCLVAFLVLMPTLVLGTWFVIMTVVIALVDAAGWMLDGGWRKSTPYGDRPQAVRAPYPEEGPGGIVIPARLAAIDGSGAPPARSR